MSILNASEMTRGKTYKVSVGAVPSNMAYLQDDGWYYFSVNFLTEMDDGILVEDFNNKLWKLPYSQYVIELN